MHVICLFVGKWRDVNGSSVLFCCRKMNGYLCSALALVLVAILAGHVESRSIEKRQVKVAANIDPHHEVRMPLKARKVRKTNESFQLTNFIIP